MISSDESANVRFFPTLVHFVRVRSMSRALEVENEWNEHFRIWMWPLDDPGLALAILAIRIPSELALLTNREAACLRCLARGLSTRDISKELDIGLTTVHTHLRRSREKLGLTT